MTKPTDKGPCNGCGRERKKHERWNWQWSEVGKLEVVAVYCPPCAAERGIKPRRKGRAA